MCSIPVRGDLLPEDAHPPKEPPHLAQHHSCAELESARSSIMLGLSRQVICNPNRRLLLEEEPLTTTTLSLPFRTRLPDSLPESPVVGTHDNPVLEMRIVFSNAW